MTPNLQFFFPPSLTCSSQGGNNGNSPMQMMQFLMAVESVVVYEQEKSKEINAAEDRSCKVVESFHSGVSSSVF